MSIFFYGFPEPAIQYGSKEFPCLLLLYPSSLGIYRPIKAEMETQKLSKKELFLSLSAASALFWVGAFFCDGYGIEAEGLVLLIPPLLAIVFGIIAIAMKDDSTKGASNVSSSQQQSSKYQDLIKLKELMDSGVITKEEFEEQKKKLLN